MDLLLYLAGTPPSWRQLKMASPAFARGGGRASLGASQASDVSASAVGGSAGGSAGVGQSNYAEEKGARPMLR